MIFPRGRVDVLEWLLDKHGLVVDEPAQALVGALGKRNWPLVKWLIGHFPQATNIEGHGKLILHVADYERLWALGVRPPSPLFALEGAVPAADATWLLEHGVMPTQAQLKALVTGANLPALKLICERANPPALPWPADAYQLALNAKHLDMVRALMDWGVPI